MNQNEWPNAFIDFMRVSGMALDPNMREVLETEVKRCLKRINGMGAVQYYHSETGWDFEHLPLGRLVEMTLEAIDDTIVYCAMLDTRLSALALQVEQDDKRMEVWRMIGRVLPAFCRTMQAAKHILALKEKPCQESIH